MLIFWSFHFRISHHYETVELLVHQTSLEGIAGCGRYLNTNVRIKVKLKRITSSNGFNNSPKDGMVHIK